MSGIQQHQSPAEEVRFVSGLSENVEVFEMKGEFLDIDGCMVSAIALLHRQSQVLSHVLGMILHIVLCATRNPH